MFLLISAGTRVTVFVTRLQDGFPMSSGDSISVTGVSNKTFTSNVYISSI